MVNYNKKALPKTIEELISFLEEPHKVCLMALELDTINNSHVLC